MGVCSSAEVASEASPEDVQYCEEGIAKLREDPNCHSLLRKALTDEVLEEIKTRKTSSFNSTLKDVIQSGVENPDSGIGVYGTVLWIWCGYGVVIVMWVRNLI